MKQQKGVTAHPVTWLRANNLHLHILTFQGYKYAGLEFMKQCFCDNTYNRYGTVNRCDKRCGGDRNQICGGDSALSVYRTRECYQYQNIHTHDVLGDWFTIPPNAATQCDRISNAPETPSLRPTYDRLTTENGH